ncbi:MAG: hypothetical protein PF904_13790 [Kiritimatiellae bacterium]|nr:hypothetical protein [Kiritimatiellia bacterium]
MVDRYELHTVRKCCEELADGNPYDPEYIAVDQGQIARDMVIHDVTPVQCVKAATKAATLSGLDAGEKELLAWCAEHDRDAMIITTGDRAAIVTACELNLREKLKSLEEITKPIGVNPKFRHHFCRTWLEQVCAAFALDNL